MNHDAATDPTPENPLAAAIALGPAIAAAAVDTERRRRISPDLLQALKRAGFMRMWLPREVGGTAYAFPKILEVFEALARYDGSTAWVTMIGSGTNFLFTGLPRDTVHEIFEPDPDIVTAGFLSARGRAEGVEGGYRISGRWQFGSGCEHSDWLMGGCSIVEGDTPVVDDQGRPQMRMMVFPRDAAVIHDTWRAAGLRGTGSHDYEVEGLFVPEGRTFRLFVDRPDFDFVHGRMPLFSTLATCMGTLALGMARGAIDALVEHARTRRFGEGLVKDLPLIRTRVAEAEALVLSARAFLFGGVERAWSQAVANEEIAARDAVLLRLAASHAVRSSAEAIQLMFLAGGASALNESNPLQRFQRDILATQQHLITAFHTFEGLGRELLDEGQDRV
jgi:alkylation response protein AidB-like acyl-CoA dehydrogenase